MNKTVIVIILALTASIVFGTARQDTTRAPMPMMSGMMGNMMQNSPMNIPGVDIAVADTPDGATVSFTTKTGDVTELRRLVRQHVEMMQNMRARMTHPKPDAK